MTKLVLFLCLIGTCTLAWGNDQDECATGQGTLIIGTVSTPPVFKHGGQRRGIELSHTHLQLKDQNDTSYDVAIDNVFASGYIPNEGVVPPPLNTLAVADQLAVCGQPFPNGIHWVHTDCGDPPTPSSPNGFVKQITDGNSGPNMEGSEKYCYIFDNTTTRRTNMRNALRANLTTMTANRNIASIVSSGDYLPDRNRTPGALNPDVTQDNIQQTICVPGWTKPPVRPPSSFTTDLKIRQMQELGLVGSTKNYEEDHLISLELGGAPKDEKNLWPEAWNGTYGAHTKDRLENRLHKLVCSGEIPLAEAQQAIATDWISAYCKYIPNASVKMPTCSNYHDYLSKKTN